MRRVADQRDAAQRACAGLHRPSGPRGGWGAEDLGLEHLVGVRVRVRVRVRVKVRVGVRVGVRVRVRVRAPGSSSSPRRSC